MHPAGGTWKDAEVLDVPEPTSMEEGHARPPEPLDPGSSWIKESDLHPPEDDRPMSETRLLLEHIDEPGLNTIDVYERLGGYASLRKALFEMTAAEVLHELEESGLRGRGGAGFSMGKKASFIPKGAMDKYLCCNADESEPGTFKDRLLMQKNPHLLIEGCIIGSIAAGANKGFIFIRGEYELQADILDAAVAEAYEKGYLGERILGSEPHLLARRAPRPGRLHLRRGDGPARRARGQARQPAPEAAVPRQPGPLPGPDADQQRRDALQHAARSSRRAREWYRQFGVGNSTGTKLVSISGNVQRPGNYEIELGIPVREIVYGIAGGPPEGREVKCFFPGGSSAPVLHAGAPRPALHVRGRWPRPARCSAPARSSSSTTRSRWCRSRCAWPSSTATSRAASACPAARAPTGP